MGDKAYASATEPTSGYFNNQRSNIRMENQNNERLTELEIRLAWQSELIDSLNDSIARIRRELDLQQDQLRLLYRRLEDKNTDSGIPTQEIPPHY